jgi:hypothetical protein
MTRKVVVILSGVVLGSLVVGVIVIPMFARLTPGEEGRLIDADNHPVAGVRVTFKDGTSTVTDGAGRFRFHLRSNRAIEIPGLAHVRSVRHTGGNPDLTYDYARAVDYEFSVKGLAGKQDPKVHLFEVTFWSLEGSPHTQFGSEGVVARNLPEAIPFGGMTVMSLSPRFSYYSFTRRSSGSKVFVEVSVTEQVGKVKK